MSASKNRPRWSDLPATARRQVEELAHGRVISAQNCEAGFSPGFASQLTLADGGRIFAKAIDAGEWPSQLATYQDEARIAAALPPGLPVPRFIGSSDDGRWLILAFEWVEGAEPARPWRPADLARTVTAVGRMSALLTPSPLVVPADQPRLGGWHGMAADAALRRQLAACSAWAAGRLSELAELEVRGLAAALGTTLVHFDALPHNILLTADQVMFVDWPHARLGAPVIDLLLVLASASADDIDPEPLLMSQRIARAAAPGDIDAILAAVAGAWVAGGLACAEPGLGPIAAEKRRLGRGATTWLQRRLASKRAGQRVR